jgi:hypothetical protein
VSLALLYLAFPHFGGVSVWLAEVFCGAGREPCLPRVVFERLWFGGGFVRREAARRFGSCGIYGRVPLLDVGDFALTVDYERRAVGNSDVLQKDTVLAHYFSFGKIAEQVERGAYLSSKFLLGRGIVRTDCKNLGFYTIEFSDTSLVRQ